MKKLLYIGHPFHLKSRSVDFLKSALANAYEIDFLNAESTCFLPETSLEPFKGKQYDVCLCLQVMPSIKMLRRYVTFRHGVFLPMADYYYGMIRVDAPIWEEYRDFRIFSFSKKIHGELLENGFDSSYIQYFPKPVNIENWGDPQSVFFWQRITHLNVYTLLDVLKGFPMKHLRLHKAIDPGEQVVNLPLAYQNGFGVSYSTWYDTREAMQKDMDDFGVYFAPRLIEGIGLAYLEAMARGRCVIANRDTTHDEYIVHGETGFLFGINDQDKCVGLTVDDVKRVQRNAYEFIKKGYADWVKVLARLPEEFEKDAHPDRSKRKPFRKISRRDPAACLLSPSEFTPATCGDAAVCSPCGGSGDYRCVATHSILGIPLVRKFVSSDGCRQKTCVFGITVFSAEITRF